MDHRSKLAWARKHRDRLAEATKAFIESKPYQLLVEFDRAEIAHTASLGKVEPIPSEWSLMLGDIVHNLRSSLDALVYALAVKHLGRPLTAQQALQVQFPIADTREKWNADRKRWLRHVDQAVHPAIEALQPFHGTDPGQVHLLSALRDLSNIDKHRHLIFTLGVADQSRVTIRVPWAIGHVWTIEDYQGPIVTGAILGKWRLPAAPPGILPKQNVQVHLAIDCIIATEGHTDGVALTPFLAGIPGFLEQHIFPQLEAFL